MNKIIHTIMLFIFLSSPIFAWGQKITHVEFETEISTQMNAFEIDQKIEALKNYFFALTNKNDKTYCELLIDSSNAFSGSTADRLRLVISGKIHCYSENDLNYLENIDIEKILDFVAEDKGFIYKILGKH